MDTKSVSGDGQREWTLRLWIMWLERALSAAAGPLRDAGGSMQLPRPRQMPCDASSSRGIAHAG